jgi:hypothetical protein
MMLEGDLQNTIPLEYTRQLDDFLPEVDHGCGHLRDPLEVYLTTH